MLWNRDLSVNRSGEHINDIMNGRSGTHAPHAEQQTIRLGGCGDVPNLMLSIAR